MNDLVKLVVGNWKMNGVSAQLAELEKLVALFPRPQTDIVICPPATLMMAAIKIVDVGPIMIGGQDCHVEPSGAHTGDISALMIKDAGGKFVIVGHSERRENHNEDSHTVCAKSIVALKANLKVIVCVGETSHNVPVENAFADIKTLLDQSIPDRVMPQNLSIAYEPVWAIGTGKTPTIEDIAKMHSRIRRYLGERFRTDTANLFRILYGGSVNPKNAAAILNTRDVDGVLVGGASLKSDTFSEIIKAAEGIH